MKFYERFESLCKQNNTSVNAVARLLSIPSGSVTAWKNGTEPRLKSAAKIADHFNVTTDFLLGKTDQQNHDPFIPVTGKVPVLGVIRAGQPLITEENIIGYEFTDVKNPEEHFYLLVEGDSMINAGIRHGSKILVHMQRCAENGQIVVCRINGADATLKGSSKRLLAAR